MKRKKSYVIVLQMLAIVVLILIAVGMFIFTNLLEQDHDIAPTAAPILTPKPKLSPTPTPSPTLTPLPTPEPTMEAEHAEEIAKLGIYEENRLIPINYVYTILYKTASGYKISFVLLGYSIPVSFVSDVFTAEDLYTLDSGMEIRAYEEGNNEGVKTVNLRLEGSEFLRLSSTIDMFYDFEPFGIKLDFDVREIITSDPYRFYTKAELADLYLKFVPKEYRSYSSDFVPGDKHKFPDITASPAPAPTATISSIK